MKVRLTLDINSGHLALTTLDLLLPLDPRGELEAIESVWHGARAPFACLSVRTALDMLLESLEHQSGDEILLSAMTLPTMATVIRSHDLVPVPVDVDPVTMAPSLEQLEERAGPRTRLFLFAHLFGGRSPLDGAMELCRKRGIPVVEDCDVREGNAHLKRWIRLTGEGSPSASHDPGR
ncbi:MAG TPA: DegT/DnrJ/EryC1/StrS aminotransferase family protein [Planctomycetes bacterium]|nr:DegT/DnrJ/EryC1/StrS aminotransferase family protein [Planctomycetota bacterium]